MPVSFVHPIDMLFPSFTARLSRTTVALAALVIASGCDLPTAPPNFEFTTGVRAPLLAEKTWVFLGPGNSGYDALIDTTSSKFDSLFHVDGSDQTLTIRQTVDDFGISSPRDVLPSVSVGPTDVRFTIADLTDDPPGMNGTVAYRPQGRMVVARERLTLDADEVQMEGPEDYIALSGGSLHIDALRNDFDVSFDEFVISVPAIRRPPYGVGDSLVIRFDASAPDPDALRFRLIDRRSGPRYETVDLAGYRLYAPGNLVEYRAIGTSESSDDIRTLEASEELRLEVRFADIETSEIRAPIRPLEVRISEDDDGDGTLDVFSDSEATASEFGGLSLFDKLDVEGFELSGSQLHLRIRTNIAADFVLYAALAGRTDEGSVTFLEGRGDLAVQPDEDAASWFSAEGTPIQTSQLLRVDIEGAPSPDEEVTRTVTLTGENSNVDAFLSALPSEFRTVSRAIIHAPSGPAHLREPFVLETSLEASIPLAVESGFDIYKTFEADLSGLRDAASDSNDVSIEDGEIEIEYANGMPFGVNLRVDILDAFDEVVSSFPADGSALRVDPAPTSGAGLSSAAALGTTAIGISRDDLVAMSGGERIRLHFELATGAGRAALRATDTFTVRLRGRFHMLLGTN